VSAAASPTIADVVTGSPSLNAVVPLMKPEMDLSGFSFHFEIVGTPRGALAAFLFPTLSVGLLAFGAVVASFDAFGSGVTPPPNPNNENVGFPLTGGTSTRAALALAAAFGAFFALG